MAKNRGDLKRRHLKWGICGLGFSGLACITWAVVNMVQPAVPFEPEVGAVSVEGGRSVLAGSSYYPLEVGRYWVYRNKDPRSGIITEVERRIVRRESRSDKDLFYFDDGTMVYHQDGKVFEIEGSGGVNVIPLDAVAFDEPYAYRSQGLYIEKSIGAVDTLLVWGGRRYESCIEIVTRFRTLHQDVKETRSFATYYARGIGRVGREERPRKAVAQSSPVLQTYGVNHL